MKKSLKVLALLTAVSFCASPALAGKHGVRGGYSLSFWTHSDAKFENVIHGPYVGYVHLMRIAPVLMFGTGVDYQLSGYRIDSDNAINQHSLSVPAYLRLGLGPVLFVAGVHGSASIVTTVPEGGDKSDYRIFDYGPFVGAGVKILAVSIDARFYSNQADRIKDKSANAFNQTFQLGATVAF